MTTDKSRYADSAQARKIDEELDRHGHDHIDRVATREERDAYQVQLDAARERDKVRSRATVRRALAQLEAFFSPNRK